MKFYSLKAANAMRENLKIRVEIMMQSFRLAFKLIMLLL